MTQPVTSAATVADDITIVENRAANVAEMFLARVRETPDHQAYRFPVGDTWESRTWRQTGDQVKRWAAGLIALGVESEQRVAIAAGTRYEWIVADLAVMCAGAATTTVYPSSIADDVGYILTDSQSQVVFAEDDTQIAKIREHREELPELRKVVTFDGTPDDGDDPWVIGIEELERLGTEPIADQPDVVDRREAAIDPQSLATLIYTSGTTGRPKGVRLRHSGWTYEGAAVGAQGILNIDDVQFLWLPMSHSFGKVLLTTQLQIGFVTAIDGRVDKIVDNLAIVKPTFMGAAPRIFEKAYGRIVSMTEAEGGPKEKLFKQAFKVGLEVERRKKAGQSVPLPLKLQHGLFDRLVFAKVRDRFGGRVRFFISGSAALNRDVAEWFNAAGIKILEGYGMTENFAGATLNHPDDYKFGSVGVPLPGTEIKI